MLAMRLQCPGTDLVATQMSVPVPADDEVLVRIQACGVCRTDLHIKDGDLTEAKWPIILGHEIVGVIEATGRNVSHVRIGDYVGIPWLGATCGQCRFCLSQRENLCLNPTFTGYSRDGGYAEYTVANAHFCFKLPNHIPPSSAAPYMCAGLIGWRSLKMAGDAQRLGIYGFGAAGHIVAQIARQQNRTVFAFTRDGDVETQEFARKLGVAWAGGSNTAPPDKLDAAIVFASAGELIPEALQQLDRGGRVVCGGIHMSNIPTFPYSILWQEKSICSVANLTRADGIEFMDALKRYSLSTTVHEYPLDDANQALSDLKNGVFDGAAVLLPPKSTLSL